MKVEITNNYNERYLQLKDLDAGVCAWIQGINDSDNFFDVLVMVTNCEGQKSYVCLENGYSRLPNSYVMSMSAIPVNVKIVKGDYRETRNF